MGRIGAIAVVTGGLLALIAWTVAPALSRQPLTAEPVEFEAAAPAPDALSARAGGRAVRRAQRTLRPVTGTVRPGKRFNLVGLRWRGGRVTALRLRTRRDDGPWSHWVELATDRDHA